MKPSKVLTIVFLLTSIGLAFYFVSSIKYDIDEDKRIAEVESDVVKKLKMIRDAQIAYQVVNGHYAPDFEKLKSFISDGLIYIVQKREHIITLDYGADSVVIDIDTLGNISVMDSLFSKDKYPNFDLTSLSLIPPLNEKEFEMEVDKIEKGGVKVDVIEVRDIDPIDKERKEDNDANHQKPLRFGSLSEVTTSGNWRGE